MHNLILKAMFALLIVFGSVAYAQTADLMSKSHNIPEEQAPWGDKFKLGDLDLMMFITQSAEDIGAVSVCSVKKGKVMYACTEMVMSAWPEIAPSKDFQWTEDKAMFFDIDFTQKVGNAYLKYKQQKDEGTFTCKDAGLIEEKAIAWRFCTAKTK